MAEVEKGETTTAVTFQSKRPTAILIVSAVLMAAFLGGALAVCFVAATTATSVSSSDAMDEESLAEYFGGLEDDEGFEFLSSSVSKREVPSECRSTADNDTTPSAQIVGKKPSFYIGSNPNVHTTKQNSWYYYPINDYNIWTCSGKGFVQGGMWVDDNGYLTVPREGTYYIYNQMMLVDLQHNRRYPTGMVTLKRSRISSGVYSSWIVLMKSVVSTKKDSAYHGGLYNLQAGDQIGIQVVLNSEPSPHVKLTAVNTYYGLFLI